MQAEKTYTAPIRQAHQLKLSKGRKKERMVPYLFLIPAFLGIFLFKLYPIVQGLVESLFAPTFAVGQKKFVGFENYHGLFTDPVFWNSVKVTLVLNVFINPIQIILALLLSLLLNQRIKGIGIFRAIHYVPIAVSMPIACVLWNVMLNQEQGIVNSILTSLGFAAQPFLGSKDQALWVVIAIATWKGVGYWAIFLLAGLQEVSPTLYEAASIDGANHWQKFLQITIPMMKRTIIFVTVADTVINFLLFAPMYLLTKGGPEGSTNVLMFESFNSAFLYSDLGRASAIVIILLILILLIIFVQTKLIKAEH